MSKVLRRFPRLLRLVNLVRYEMIYAIPIWRELTTFNVGISPADPEILAQPAGTREAFQLQTYAEVFRAADAERPVRPGDVMVEIAAGRGGGLGQLAGRADWRCIGFERSWSAVRHARARGLDMRRAGAEQLPQPAASCDYVVSVEGLMCCEDVIAATREAARLLCHDGCLVLAEFHSGPIHHARAKLVRRARACGLTITDFTDMTERARAAFLADEPRRAALVASVPRLIVAGFAEMLGLDGTTRHAQWRDGQRSYYIATLRPRRVAVPRRAATARPDVAA
ncbi:class I SAM-dependent methyltransferase [Methylobrevis albus]|uniref:Class I SAM-dependent methyltransferase n=1 Tax=Methylobrevis albus TaxID=2793297 RepID=A0A931HZD2_9HYPH|nr:methyltransferase domain-containing protein [Methylobrevis albus]MBH0236892.1 class I SAM-dependent methyltransferase [Methylobrevis albus]